MHKKTIDRRRKEEELRIQNFEQVLQDAMDLEEQLMDSIKINLFHLPFKLIDNIQFLQNKFF